MRKPTIWVPTRSDTNRPVQAQKMVRGRKFWIWEEEELYHPCSENKGADQLRSYCEADLRLCLCLCRLLVFPYGGSFVYIANCPPFPTPTFSVNWLDHAKTLREQGVESDETLLLRRKFFFSDQNVDARDPVQLNLLFVQV